MSIATGREAAPPGSSVTPDQAPAGTAAGLDRELGTSERPPSGTDVVRDRAAWDDFVAKAAMPTYMQLSAWARVKAPNGWKATRVVADGESGPIGAQVLVHPLGPSPWSVAYAPRGPVAGRFDPEGVRAFTERLRAVARRSRSSHVTIDPEVTPDDPLVAMLREARWTPGTRVQPNRTRLIDLTQPEEALWADLRSKWRQYVNKARRQGVVVVESDASGLDDFYSIYVETARRAGFFHRAARAYRAVYDAYAATGNARLLFARLPDGTPAATLMLLTCGPKVVEPYGGMTQAGAESRANYLLKWEAIRSSRQAGFRVYDMWGLAHPGIERFKSGFGGREVEYAGAFELVTSRPIHAVALTLQRARVLVARRRFGIGGADQRERRGAGDGGADAG